MVPGIRAASEDVAEDSEDDEVESDVSDDKGKSVDPISLPVSVEDCDSVSVIIGEEEVDDPVSL